jgi:hypothetical protein
MAVGIWRAVRGVEARATLFTRDPHGHRRFAEPSPRKYLRVRALTRTPADASAVVTACRVPGGRRWGQYAVEGLELGRTRERLRDQRHEQARGGE